jgi:hypothetical protein
MIVKANGLTVPGVLYSPRVRPFLLFIPLLLLLHIKDILSIMGLLGEMTVRINGDVSGLVSAGNQAS